VYLWVWLLQLASIKFFIGITHHHISSDGIGYYEYLPSLFIYHDFGKNNQITYNYQRKDTTIGYVDINGYKVIKYPVGVSVLLSPFFSIAYLIEYLKGTSSITGYESTFQELIWIGAQCYFLLTLYLLQQILQKLLFSYNTQWFILLALGLATNTIHYLNGETAFSHVYGQFLVTVFIYLFVHFKQTAFYYSLISLTTGLLFLTRPNDLLIVLFIPYLLNNRQKTYYFFKTLFSKPSHLFSLVVPLVGCVLLQLFLWYLQSKKYWIDTYKNEHFNFSNPHIIEVLFSYEKGLFVYTPVLLLLIPSVIVLFWKKLFYRAIAATAFFSSIIYVLSSWEVWWYNCGYGQRAFIDFYAGIFLVIAFFVEKSTLLIKRLLWLFLVLVILINNIQARQYRLHIFNWEKMDKVKYWNVFLSNSNRFIGFNYKKEYQFNQYRLVWAKKFSDTIIPQNQTLCLTNSFKEKLTLTKKWILKFSVVNNFERSNRALVKIALLKNKRFIYNKQILFTNLSNTFLGVKQYGYYVFEINDTSIQPNQVQICIVAKNMPVVLEKPTLSIREIK
jgi:hypothetical protein